MQAAIVGAFNIAGPAEPSRLSVLALPATTASKLVAGLSTNVKKIHHLDLIWLKQLFSIRKKFTFCVCLQNISLKILEVTVS